MRLTKIICTLGPVSSTPEQVRTLVEHGMNIARVNLSHGSQDQHMQTITMLQELLKEGLPFAIMLDTKGCEIRTGDRTTPLTIAAGQEVAFSPTPLPDEKREVILVNYELFADDVRKSSIILLDNGEMNFDIVRIEGKTVIAKSQDDGLIGSRRHVNLPGVDIQLPSVTDKDWEDLAMGATMGIDYVALSFIRRGSEVESVRKFLKEKKSSMRIISKIETKLGVENIEELIAASDGIMVARGDLGAEIPYEQVPGVQDRIVRLCRAAGKPVIVATQMLESMIEHPMPTRAEVTDVAHAANSRCDATMLSGETAMGKYSVGCVDAMARIVTEAERSLPPVDVQSVTGEGEYEAQASAAVTMAQALQASAIVVFTPTTELAQSLSKFRPLCPIIACTADLMVQQQLQLNFGVFPFATSLDGNAAELTARAIQVAVDNGFTKSGQKIVVVSDTVQEHRIN